MKRSKIICFFIYLFFFVFIACIKLSVIYIIEFISSYAEALFFMKNIKLAEYDVVFQNNTNSMLIITGLALMIISQIILMGKDLKDEQELTI